MAAVDPVTAAGPGAAVVEGGRAGLAGLPGLPALRRAARRRPEYAAVLAAGAAWVAVLGLHATSGERLLHASGDGPPALRAALALPGWTVMAVAMMVPPALPVVRHVGTNSLRWRRQRAIGQFLAAYVGVWALFGLLALTAAGSVRVRLGGDGMLAVALAVAAGWQLLPYQRRFLRDCHRTVPLPPRGWAAAAGCARFGVRHGRACVGVCGPLMLVMAAAAQEALLWMVVLAAASGVLRLLPRNERTRARLGWGLGLLALIVALR